MTPDIVKVVVEARLLQTFRQYPRAALHLSSSCRDRINNAISRKLLAPEPLRAFIQPTADTWTLQARIAFNDIFKFYQDSFLPDQDEHNVALLQAVSAGILAAGKIQVS